MHSRWDCSAFLRCEGLRSRNLSRSLGRNPAGVAEQVAAGAVVVGVADAVAVDVAAAEVK